MTRRSAQDSTAMRTALAPPKTTYRRDFRTENIMRLADVAAVNTERRAIEEAGAPPAWKSTRYDAVPSRVAEVIHAPPPPPEPTRVRAPKPVETVPAIPAKFVRPEAVPRKPSVPTKTELAATAAAVPSASRTVAERDFIRENARAAASGGISAAGVSAAVGGCGASPSSPADEGRGASAASSVRSPRSARSGGLLHASAASPGSTAAKFGSPETTRFLSSIPDSTVISKHAEYGAVPAYLRERQAQWSREAEARAKAEAERDVPAGMRLLPDEERRETLALLEARMAEAREELGKFKLRLVVPSQIRRKAELEEKLTKMEEAVKVFSKPRVLVKIGE